MSIKGADAISISTHSRLLPLCKIPSVRKAEKNMISCMRISQRCLALAIAFLKPEGPRTVGSMIVVRMSGTEISTNNFKSQR